MHLCIKHSWSHCIFLMIITFPSNPPPGLFPSPLLKHFAPVSDEMTLTWGEGGVGVQEALANGSKWKALAGAWFCRLCGVTSHFDRAGERPRHHHPLRDPRKVLWCFIMQIITQNAAEDPKSPLRCWASQSPHRVMYPCRSPADALIVHPCPPSLCQHQGLLTQSCPHKAVLIRTTKTFLLLCVNLKVRTSQRLLKHRAIMLIEIWLKMCEHQMTSAWVRLSQRQSFQNENKWLWSKTRGQTPYEGWALCSLPFQGT